MTVNLSQFQNKQIKNDIPVQEIIDETLYKGLINYIDQFKDEVRENPKEKYHYFIKDLEIWFDIISIPNALGNLKAIYKGYCLYEKAVSLNYAPCLKLLIDNLARYNKENTEVFLEEFLFTNK